MRRDYGFDPLNRVTITRKVERHDNGRVKRIQNVKFIYPKHTIDAAAYTLTRIKCYDESGKLKFDTLEEHVFSVWGYNHTKGRCKVYSDTAAVKVDRFESKQSGW
jgi:hypothetical protein